MLRTCRRFSVLIKSITMIFPGSHGISCDDISGRVAQPDPGVMVESGLKENSSVLVLVLV